MTDRKASGWRWQDKAAGGGLMDEEHPQRRVVGVHDLRSDGLADLLSRARGASVIDIGMNRGHLAYDFAMNGARVVHGCDIYGPGVQAARHWFAELPHVESKFEVVDLTRPGALKVAFGPEGYDIVLFIGVYHKLVRIMDPVELEALMKDLATRSLTYFGFNGYTEHLPWIDRAMVVTGLRRVHLSQLMKPDRSAAIWKRVA